MNRIMVLPALLAFSAAAQTLAVVNARIVPVSGPVIDKGTIIVENGRISVLGPRVAVPKNARRVDESITLWPAELLGVEKEIGSLEVGKRANLVLWDGDPFDSLTDPSRLHRRPGSIARIEAHAVVPAVP